MFFRMMMDILKDQMYINVFAYVDDIMVACKKKRMQIDDNRDLRKHARSPIETQPREMCIWCAKGQSTRVPGIHKRNGSPPTQNQCNSAHETSSIQKISLEAHR
jgi:hypothetical protein